MQWIIVAGGRAYGPFSGRTEAVEWVGGSNYADEAYSIYPLAQGTKAGAIAQPLVRAWGEPS